MLQVLLVAVLGVLGAKATDYTDPGPYDAESKTFSRRMPGATGCWGWNCGITVTVTKPTGEALGFDFVDREPPFPVVFMYNGFQMSASYYRAYVDHLVSYGYVVVQYDTTKFHLYTDKVEMKFFPYLLDWLRSLNSEPGSFLHGLLDLDRIGATGHSRGGKLAALGIANNPSVKSAYLIDPVDGDSHFAKESEDYPSAAKALAGKDKRIGLVGSGVTGRCTPEGFNYKEFYKSAGVNSWMTIIYGAGHCQFISAPSIVEWAMGLLCGHSQKSCKDIITVTRPGMVAWFEEDFRGSTSTKYTSTQSGRSQTQSFLDAFFKWIQHMEKARVLEFTVKGNSKAELNRSQQSKVWVA